MYSPRLKSQLAQVDAEIAAAEAQLASLRRRRNLIMPISALPPELTTAIIKLATDDAIDAFEWPCGSTFREDSTYRAYKWITFAHVYSHWRDVVSQSPALWSFICTTNVDGFKAYLERSKSHSLDIAIKHTFDPEHGKTLFRLAMANIERVRSLCLSPPSIDWDHIKSRGMDARHLEALQVTGDATRENTNQVNSSIVMPKLRKLVINREGRDSWLHLLPSKLPTVTDLTLERLSYQDELDILTRCTGIRRLYVKSYSLPSDQIQAITLPHLLHLEYKSHDSIWRPFFRLILPSIQRVDIRTHVFSVQEGTTYFESLEKILNSSTLNNLTCSRTRLHHLSLAYCPGQAIEVEAQDSANNTFVRLTVEFEPKENHSYPTLHEFHKNLVRFTQSSRVEISSVDIQDTDDWDEENFQSTLHRLHDRSDIHTVRTRSSAGLLHFLSHPNIKVHRWCFDEYYELDVCPCDECHEMRVASYPGLRTLLLDDMDGGVNWDVVVRWVEGRKQQGVGLETLSFAQNAADRLDPSIFGRMLGAVANVVVENRHT